MTDRPSSGGFQKSQTDYKFEFILSDRKFYVRDEHELALVFELLAKTKTPEMYHWNVIMSLNDSLLSIIRTHTWLVRCVRHISNKNRFLLFLKIADNLPGIIGNSENFARILASIPESDDQDKLLKMLRRKGILSFVNSPKELGKILEWATSATERKMISLLGADFIRSLIASSRDFYDILYLIHASNKQFFFEMIGWDFVQSRVFTADDFFYTLKAIDLQDTEAYLSLFDPNWIRSIICTEENFHSYLRKLSFSKQDPLLRYLSYDPEKYNSIPR